MERRSAPPILSTWNDLASIIGVPLSAFLSLCAIVIMIKHHREARRHGEAQRALDTENLAGIPPPGMLNTSIQPESIGAADGVFQLEPRVSPNIVSACQIPQPARASTHTGICINTRTHTPARASTYAGTGTTRLPCDVSTYMQPSPLRGSQITLIDEQERSNPTMIIAYPKPAHLSSMGRSCQNDKFE